MKKTLALLTLLTVATSVGCRQEPPLSFEANLVHSYKYQLTRELPMEQVVEDTQWALTELFGTPNEPKIPAFISENEDLAGLVSIERLEVAAGPEVYDADGDIVGGLYRAHCVNCHGMTGTGRGPAGVGVTPYPRDYRMGVFKYKSTSRGSKPTREDVADLIRHGIGGTAMNPIPGLSEEGVQALVDYVIFLSWRGEVERQVIDGAMFDLDLEGGDRVINPSLVAMMDRELDALSDEDVKKLDEFETTIDEAMDGEIASRIDADSASMTKEQLDKLLVKFGDELEEEQLEAFADKSVAQLDGELLKSLLAVRYEDLSTANEKEIRDAIAARVGTGEQVALRQRQRELDSKELFAENWSYIVEAVEDVAGAWFDAEEDITNIEPTGEIPVPKDRAEFLAMLEGEQAEALQASVERGHELFASELVGCAKCHGKEGKGDGQTSDYDDWTKDWTVSVGLDPKDTMAIMPLMARGAWEPKNIVPRNFAEGIFRGGSQPRNLFHRIANGIAGTPMPAATFVDGEFSRQDIWHIINFIRSLDQTELPDEETAKPAMTDAAMR